MMKNKAYRDSIKRSPYKSIFDGDVKVGLKSSYLPSEIIDDVLNAEHLEELIKNQEVQEQSINATQSEERVVSSADLKISDVECSENELNKLGKELFLKYSQEINAMGVSTENKSSQINELLVAKDLKNVIVKQNMEPKNVFAKLQIFDIL
ncbi:hypothetical protein FQA39_LY06189 [Lamprigera yunnana]|nr:hypothetical protein FQA39_LY06189 [Lamprigera yunnana]